MLLRSPCTPSSGYYSPAKSSLNASLTLLYHTTPLLLYIFTQRQSPSRLHYFLRVMTLVIACLITTPAFSVSRFDKPAVTHTLRAGCGCHGWSLGPAPSGAGMLLRRVISTPFANAYE